jgi:hypothetical protein
MRTARLSFDTEYMACVGAVAVSATSALAGAFGAALPKRSVGRSVT